MKKMLLVILASTCFFANAQISPFATINKKQYLIPIFLTENNFKYLVNDFDENNTLNQFTLLNPDGSFYKSVSLPPKPDNSALTSGPFCITSTLFDTDSNNFEYMVTYRWDSAYSGESKYTMVVREDGTVLLNEMNAYDINEYTFGTGGKTLIYDTPDGPMLKLEYSYANQGYDMYKSTIFNLPGSLPKGLKNLNKLGDNQMIIYPNPTTGVFYLKVQNENGIADLKMFSLDGRIVSTIQTSDNPVRISAESLPDGIYFVRLLNSDPNGMTVKKVIIQR